MACTYTEHDTLPIVEIRVIGRVTDHDMEEILPKLEKFIDRHGTIRVLEVIERFDGFDPTTVLDGMKFDLKHISDVTHVAVVSDVPWISFITQAAAMVMPITVRAFDLDRIDEARSWLERPE